MELRGEIVGMMSHYKQKLDNLPAENDAMGKIEAARKEYKSTLKDLEKTLQDVEVKIEIYNGTYGKK